MVGAGIGAYFGGKMMIIGRRKLLIYASILGIVSNLITSVLDIHFIRVGRFFFGIANGIYCSTVTKFILETVPHHLYGPLCNMYNLGLHVGFMFAFALAAVLP